jgi:hypothetical protein
VCECVCVCVCVGTAGWHIGLAELKELFTSSVVTHRFARHAVNEV